jgi:hypothetical protein
MNIAHDCAEESVWPRPQVVIHSTSPNQLPTSVLKTPLDLRHEADCIVSA